MPSTASSTAQIFGIPKGVLLLAFTELWERFSYFAILALLTLYLTADVSVGGWGWSSRDAIALYGFYAGFVYAVPVIGAWIANNYLGERRCILIGALLFMLGHGLLAVSGHFPAIVGAISGVDVRSILLEAAVQRGRWWESERIVSAIDVTAGAAPAERLALAAYRLEAIGFFGGLACIVAATGFFKSTIASLISRFYPNADARRDAGYALLFTCIFTGAVLANLIAGGMGEVFGWTYGFAVAAAGMGIAISLLMTTQRRYLGDLGLEPDLRAHGDGVPSDEPLAGEERDRLRVILLQGLFTILYASAFYQKGGMLNLYTRDTVDRALFGVQVPATWFLSISTLVFMIATPTFAYASLRLARSSRNPSASYKLAAGLLIIGMAYAVIALAEWQRLSAASARIDAGWLIATYVLFGIAEALVWPNQLALATKLAPRRYVALTIGAWHLTVAFGVWLASLYGSFWERLGSRNLFVAIAGLCLLAGSLALILTPRMRGLMHGAERTDTAAAA